MLEWLSGKKTYIGMIASGILGLIVALGYAQWTDEWVQVVTVMLLTFTGVSARAAITKSGS